MHVRNNHQCFTQARLNWYTLWKCRNNNIFSPGQQKNPKNSNATVFVVVTETEVFLKQPLTKNDSVQTVKFVALTEACKLMNKKVFNVYTDSQYAFSTVHVLTQQWENRYVDIHS